MCKFKEMCLKTCSAKIPRCAILKPHNVSEFIRIKRDENSGEGQFNSRHKGKIASGTETAKTGVF